MKNLFAWVVIGAVACVFSVGSLYAQDAAKKKQGQARAQVSPEERFKKVDADSDGSLTLDEFKASLRGPLAEQAEAIFKIKDTDKDGKLSLDEFKTISFEEFAARFDEDKDGKITLDEMKKAAPNAEMAEKMFKMRDANGDGAITKEDFAQAKGAKQGGGKKGKKAAEQQ